MPAASRTRAITDAVHTWSISIQASPKANWPGDLLQAAAEREQLDPARPPAGMLRVDEREEREPGRTHGGDGPEHRPAERGPRDEQDRRLDEEEQHGVVVRQEREHRHDA